MKNAKQIIVLGLISLCIGSIHSNEIHPTNKKALSTMVLPSDINPSENFVKIALLLDTSNSMDGLINQAKAQLWDIVNKFSYVRCGNSKRPKLQIAIYEYGNDNLSSREGYIRQVIDFSSDLDEISEKLFSLTTNGGEEYCGQVIQTSLKQLKWGKNPDNLKMIFIAGNEPFSQGKLNYKDAVTNAKEKDVIVNTIFCGNYQQGVSSNWKNGAVLANGEYMAINHNKQIVYIDTPYDDVIIQLNSKLNKTYVSYGALGVSKMKKQATQDTNAMELEEVVAIKRTVSKSSRLYSNSSWDLVDASKDKNFTFSKIKKEQLPETLRNKSTAEIKAYVAKKSAKRIAIQKEIQELNTKREAFIAKNQKENTKGELENAMLQAIMKQAKKKNYTWK
ncbi:MAG: vWA domain-containing protein [Cellulophaga sp.]